MEIEPMKFTNFTHLLMEFVCLGLLLVISLGNAQLQSDVPISVIVWSNQGERLAVGRQDGVFEIIDARGNIMMSANLESSIQSITWNPNDQDEIAVAVEDGPIRILKLSDTEYRILQEWRTGYYIKEIAWNPTGTKIATHGETGGGASSISTVQIWDATTSKLIATYDPGESTTVDIAWRDTSELLITQVTNNFPTKLLLWNVDNNILKWTVEEARSGAITVNWSPDKSKFVLSIGIGQAIVQLRETVTGNLIKEIPTSVFAIADTAWITETELLLAYADGIEIWDANTAQLKHIIQTSESPRRLIPSPYGGRVFYGDLATEDLPDQQAFIDTTFDLRYIVPDPSFDQLGKISAQCVAESETALPANNALAMESVSALTKATLPNFITQVKALPEGAIPPACAADLIAVAEAIIAQP
jgi:WD40 repeat protein